jgi:hypothetical protein
MVHTVKSILMFYTVKPITIFEHWFGWNMTLFLKKLGSNFLDANI